MCEGRIHASKERCALARDAVMAIADEIGPAACRRVEDHLAQVLDFLDAAERKLPREISWTRDRAAHARRAAEKRRD